MIKGKNILLPLLAGVVVVSAVSTIAIVDALTPALVTVNRTYGDIEGIPTVSLSSEILAVRPELSQAISKVDEIHAGGGAHPGSYEMQISSIQAKALTQALPFQEITKPDEEYRSYYLVLDYNDNMYVVGVIFE